MKAAVESEPAIEENENAAPLNLQFSGRLSAILPREADPAISPAEVHENTEEPLVQEEPVAKSMALDQVDTIVVDTTEAQTTTPPCSPPKVSVGGYEPRAEHESPFDDSDSEDELASEKYSPAGFQTSSHDFAISPATPFIAINKTPKTINTRRSLAKEKIGFTPLARQLSEWMGASPEKSDNEELEAVTPTKVSSVNPSPAKSTFFEDEMEVRDNILEAEARDEGEVEPLIVDELEFEPIELDEEDLALANEADELSLLEPDEIQELVMADTLEASEPTPSEASQEYGDENALPIDPALLALPGSQVEAALIFATPKRILTERVFHTVSKVPLKPAADETPIRPSPVKRSASISKLPVSRPSSNLSRSNTVISYSPAKSTPGAQHQEKNSEDSVMQDTMSTPARDNAALWSTMGTPARTPRRDLNTALLKGAVVFVDVHTTEGADASPLFTELLVQMGARCVKSWNWNGNGEDGSKIGITHVVFKDGGKRTLEKARETGGVVSCVGVGWVLEYVPRSAQINFTDKFTAVNERTNGWMNPYMLLTLLLFRVAVIEDARVWNLELLPI